MYTQEVSPNVKNFVKSLRDIGYSFEVAVADILDNAITANARSVEILALAEPAMSIQILDNGIGMTEPELIEAMRLSSKDPDDAREKNDLGKFGLGLKTASFSQAKKITVISKKDDKLSLKQWDLNFVSENNKWLLITPNIQEFKSYNYVQKLQESKQGTVIIWEDIDSCEQNSFQKDIERLREHLSLVFHRFMEVPDPLKISVNGARLKAFNPFHLLHPATQEKSKEVIKINGKDIVIRSYILPHHSKVSQENWRKYETTDGYIKSQGFYLYREKRLLIHGTWWGLHKAKDAHKLVRIQIDIANDQDLDWNIDVKKSSARPREEIRAKLKNVIANATELSARTFTGRGKRIKSNKSVKFWEQIPVENNDFRYGINKQHPLAAHLIESLSEENKAVFNSFIQGLEAYLPLESIQAQQQANPHNIKQQSILEEVDLQGLVEQIKSRNLSEEEIKYLLKSELFIGKEELFDELL